MPFDFKQYRKVHHTPHHSIFRHKDGHEIKVLHDKLDPKVKAEVMKLPKRNAAPMEAYADGGKVAAAPQPKPQQPQGPQINPQDAANIKNAFTHGYADGGEIEGPAMGAGMGIGMSPEAPAQPDQSYLEIGLQNRSPLSQDAVSESQHTLEQRAVASEAAAVPQNVQLGLQSGIGQPQGDIYGTGAYDAAYSQGVNEQKAGLRNEAKAVGDQGKAEAQLIQGAQEKQATLQQHTEQQFAELEQERQGLYKDLADGHIDPNHYMGSMDTSSKVTTAIGLILGGMGGGLTGQENPVLSFLNKQIDRDIQAQQANLNKKESLLNANMKHFGNLKDATEMTRVMMMDGVKLGLQKAAAAAQDLNAKARALQAIGKIDQDSAAVMSQLASRKALVSSGGAADPSVAIRMLVDPHSQGEAYKELKAAQGMGDQKKNLLNAFDQLQEMGTVGRTLSPHKAEALREPLLAQLVKDSEGRITPQDTEMIRTLFPKFGDSAETSQLKRHQLDKFVSEKMHFPILNAYGLAPKGKVAPAPNLNAPRKK